MESVEHHLFQASLTTQAKRRDCYSHLLFPGVDCDRGIIHIPKKARFLLEAVFMPNFMPPRVEDSKKLVPLLVRDGPHELSSRFQHQPAFLCHVGKQ
jgi:hypothetical protein